MGRRPVKNWLVRKCLRISQNEESLLFQSSFRLGARMMLEIMHE